MRWLVTAFIIGFSTLAGLSQSIATCSNAAFDAEVKSYLSFTVDLIDVDALNEVDSAVVILDAREHEEYTVSHIPGARHVGYKKFDLATLDEIPRESRVVVYCSIGYRSEKIGEKLVKAGFDDVSNLYGSIFEWANRGYPLVDNDGKPTKRLHTYSRKWSRWVEPPGIVKVW